MKSVSTDSNRVVSFGEKVSYGITEIACNPMYTIFCSILYFSTPMSSASTPPPSVRSF